MVGKMKPIFGDKNLREQHWLSYCASCKSIGSEYGQLYRFGLNYDLVLLGQLAADSAGIAFGANEIKPKQCFTKTAPDHKRDKLMRYISALHIFWYKVKINDNAEDEGTWHWRFLKGQVSSGFRKACVELASFGVDLKWVEIMLEKQKQLEHAETSLHKTVETYAYPTGMITGHFFKYAAQAAGAPSPVEDQFRALGYEVGKALYITDAADDLAVDLKKGHFNPYSQFTNEDQFSIQETEQIAKNDAVAAWNRVEESMGMISFSSLTKRQFTSRISSIINQLKVGSCAGCCTRQSGGNVLKKAAAAASVTLLPTVLLAQSHRGGSQDDECGTCTSCIVCSCCCCIGYGLCASPNSSANCACDCCCADDPNCTWYE